MKTIYIADDGKVFDSKYDCEKYEMYLKHKSHDMAVVADKSGKIIPFDDCYKPDGGDSCFSNVRYIYAATPEQYENLYEAMCTEYGMCITAPERVKCYPAMIYYDDKSRDWIDFCLVYSDAMYKKEIFERMKESLS